MDSCILLCIRISIAVVKKEEKKAVDVAIFRRQGVPTTVRLFVAISVASSDDDNAASMQQLTLTSTSISDIDLDDSLVIFVSNQTPTNGKSDREDNTWFPCLWRS